jgi:DNA-binding response OmpR family regulator
MRILIIDDDVSTTTTLKALLLSREPFDIDVAYGAQEGFDKMLKNPLYDLIILDVMMPDVSGMDVCKAMNKNDKLKNIPVLLASALPITSKELHELLEEFKELAVIRGVLEKPFVIDDLLEKIKEIKK